jgi:hypothetical protein
VRNIQIKKYNIIYIDCSDLIINTYISILRDFLDINKLKDKDLKKLIFHYIVKSFISRNKHSTKRPVYFFNRKFIAEFTDKRYIKCFLIIIKNLKSLIPVPIILIDNENLFSQNRGELKGLNEKITSYYLNSNKNTIKLRKYLKNEDFYELIEAFKDINNIKYITT